MNTGISRRQAIIGAAALVGAGHRAVAAGGLDVVVVGAGAAGLFAAKRLAALGRSVTVIEARRRLGGRVQTDTRLGIPFDAGAQYIHWAERNPWTKAAAELGLATADETGGNPLRIYANGVVIPEAERGERRRAFMRIDGLIASGSSPDRSITEAVLAGGGGMLEAASGLTRLTLGEEPDRVSAADYAQLWTGGDLVVAEGYGTLVERYGARLEVRTGVAARRIDWSGAGVAVETDRGTIRARAAVVTASIGVVQAGGIAFSPALPAATRDAFAGLRMGAYTKIALKLDRVRLDMSDLADAIDLESPGATTSFELLPAGRDLAIAYLGGDFARRLCEAGEAAAVDHATERLVAIFGTRLRGAVTGGVLANWWTDPLSRGAYSIARPGRLEARLALRRPVGRRIWFAGEASAGGGAMTAGGAALDGERAADDVSRHLSV